MVHLYSLSTPPTLTGHEVFSIENQQPALLTTQIYQYFMPKGSKFSVLACIMDFNDALVTYYVIKGAKNYGQWKGHKGHHFEGRLDITTGCESGSDSNSYSVQSDDFYYLVFDSEVSYGAINISMYFEKTWYEVCRGTVLDDCQIITSYSNSFESCGVSLPLSGTVSLLTVQPEDFDVYDIDWTNVVYVDISCSARVWMYVVIALAVLVGIVGILTILLLCLCMYQKKEKTQARLQEEKNKRTRLQNKKQTRLQENKKQTRVTQSC